MADLTGMYQWLANSYNQGLQNTTAAMGQYGQSVANANQGLMDRMISERDRLDQMREKEWAKALKEREMNEQRQAREFTQDLEAKRFKITQAEEERKKLREPYTLQALEQGLTKGKLDIEKTGQEMQFAAEDRPGEVALKDWVRKSTMGGPTAAQAFEQKNLDTAAERAKDLQIAKMQTGLGYARLAQDRAEGIGKSPRGTE